MTEQPAPPTRIISLKPTKRRPDRLTIRVGSLEEAEAGTAQTSKRGTAFATLCRERVDEMGLVEGQPWDEALAAKVGRIAAYDQAMDAARKRLNRRAMTRHMLNRKLAELDHDPSTRQAVLDHLTEAGLIDDYAFGQMLIREAQVGRPAGAHLLRKKMFDKGIDRDLVERLITENTPDEADQREAGLNLARKRLATMQGLDKRTKLRRLQGLLARRGFDADLCRDVVETLADEMETDAQW